MTKPVLLLSFLLFLVFPFSGGAQDLRIDERFGMQIDFPEGWSLLSEDLYSSMLQRQLFANEQEDVFVFVEYVFTLTELNKREWAFGINGYPLASADTVITIEQEDWPFEAPLFDPDIFSRYPNGASVFLGEAANWIGYVVFVSRNGTFTKINISASKEDREPDMEALYALLSLLTFSEKAPQLPEDPYTIAHRMYIYNRDYERAMVLYEEVPEEHPKYADAQRIIGHAILGRQFSDWTAAVPYVEEAYRVSPNDPNVLEDIGRVYLMTDRQEEGIALLERAGTPTARRAIKNAGK